jgi:hypothetical protein
LVRHRRDEMQTSTPGQLLVRDIDLDFLLAIPYLRHGAPRGCIGLVTSNLLRTRLGCAFCYPPTMFSVWYQGIKGSADHRLRISRQTGTFLSKQQTRSRTKTLHPGHPEQPRIRV